MTADIAASEEIRKEMKRIVDCGWEAKSKEYWRFSFRCSPKTMERWKELCKDER